MPHSARLRVLLVGIVTLALAGGTFFFLHDRRDRRTGATTVAAASAQPAATATPTPTPTPRTSSPAAVRVVRGALQLRPTARPGPGAWMVYTFTGPRRLVRWAVSAPFTTTVDTRTLPNGTYALTEVVVGGTGPARVHSVLVRIANPAIARKPSAAPSTPAPRVSAPPAPAAPAPRPSSPARGTPVPQADTSVTGQVVTLTNAERAKAGCKALTVDSRLTAAAQTHSADMAAHNYFDHNSRNGTTPFQRMTAAGYRYSTAAENIAAGQSTPAAVMNAWMNSAGHRANILNCALTQIGVGYATGGTYGSYWTQDFGTP